MPSTKRAEQDVGDTTCVGCGILALTGCTDSRNRVACLSGSVEVVDIARNHNVSKQMGFTGPETAPPERYSVSTRQYTVDST